MAQRKEENIMLIKCPECDLQASDKAVSCPHCGYPFQQQITQPKSTRKSNKRKRLPNGFGQISKIKNKSLRNPYRVMITVGKTPEGKPISKLLKPVSYFPTYNDAYAALVEYSKNPYDLDKAITVEELYDRWFEEYLKKEPSDSYVRTMKSAWNYCSSIKDMQVSDVRTRHIKYCMEEGTYVVRGKEQHASPSVKHRIKSMFNLMLDYALEYEIVDRNYARSFNTPDKVLKEEENNKKEHIPFTDEEMELLWSHVDDMNYVDVVLIQCYSGWRPQELGLIKLEDVNMESWTYIGGMKTDAGISRIVPIHPRIRHLVEKKYDDAIARNSSYLINKVGKYNYTKKGLRLTYDNYRKRFINIRTKLGLNPEHRTHDPRVQFVTMAKKYKVDEYAIKYIVGHTISDVTEKIYTKRDIEWLHSEIQKIK